MPLGGLVIAGAGLAYSAYKGIKNDTKANQINKGLTDPTYNIPAEFYQNRELARQMAQRGLPQQQYNNQVNAINQNQAGAIAAQQNSANPGAGIASTVRAGNQATNTLNAEDAQARENNQRYFIQQNSAVSGQELAKQQNDVYDKYTRDFNEMQAYKGAANQNYNNAINGAQQLGLSYINSQNGSDGSTPPSQPGGNWGYPPYVKPTGNFAYGANWNPASEWGATVQQPNM